VCVLTSSGRLASWDAGAQLQSSLLVASAGTIGTTTPPEPRWFWVANAHGVSYDTHDLGGLLLMLPAAVTATYVHHPPSGDSTVPGALVANPPAEAKLLASLSYALAGAVACTLVFASLLVFCGARDAFIGSMVFLACTGVWPYFRTAWDVTGAAAAIAAFQYGMVRLDADERSGWRAAAFTGVAAAAAVTFRFSMLPVVGIAGATQVWLTRKKLRLSSCTLLIAAFAIAAAPQLAYNAVRTGNPLVPGNRAPIYAGQNSLDGNPIAGFAGLIASPHRGLVFFAPIVLLAVFAPRLVTRSIPEGARSVTIAGLAGAACYVAMISAKREWGSFGWGPRYLVPVLPLLFLPIGLSLREAWRCRPRTTALLVALSLLATLPAVIVNWSLAVAEHRPDAGLLWPAQHEAVWLRVAGALRSPDNWLLQLGRLSVAGTVTALGVLAAGLVAVWGSSRLLLRPSSPAGALPVAPLPPCAVRHEPAPPAQGARVHT
jgi:hypothetical protein